MTDKNTQQETKLSNKYFLKWIKIPEKSPTISLEKFNEKWEEKNLQILKKYAL